MRILRAQTRDTQRGVAAATRIIAIRAAQQLELQNELLARRSGLLAARRSQQQALASVRSNYRDDASEAAALEKVSSQLAAQIQAAQAAAQQTYSPTASVTQSAPSSLGLHLAGQRRRHERVRLALGPDARGHRHRRRATARRSTPPPPAP